MTEKKKYIGLCNLRSDAGDSSGEPVIEFKTNDPTLQRPSPTQSEKKANVVFLTEAEPP